MNRNFFLFLIINFMIACGHLERSKQSGYSSIKSQKSDVTTIFSPKISQSLNRIMAELGMNQEDLKISENLQRVKDAMEIKQIESQMSDERERRQYYKNLPWLKNEKEQLEFLKQNGYYARQVWLRKNSVGKRPTETSTVEEELIAAKDIALGMPNELVRRSWGPPDGIDVAGNPIYGNERWRYKRQTPSPEGYRLQSRIIYFESGKVVGWEQIDH